jgi:hypothetical protein
METSLDLDLEDHKAGWHHHEGNEHQGLNWEELTASMNILPTSTLLLPLHDHACLVIHLPASLPP